MAKTIDEMLHDELVHRQAFRQAYGKAVVGACSWAAVYRTWGRYQAALRVIPDDKIPDGHQIDDWNGIPREPLRTMPYRRP